MKSENINLLTAKLRKECEGKVTKNYPLSKYISMAAGGPAAVFLSAENVDDLRLAVTLCSQYSIPYFVLGNGTNILVPDNGFSGLAIRLGREFLGLKVEGNRIICGAGVSLSKVLKSAGRYSLKGLEFAAGIPATVGGAVASNAGAYGKSVNMHLTHVNVFTPEGLKSYEKKEIAESSSYRKSFLSEGEIVIEAVFNLTKANRKDIEKEIKTYLQDRKSKQPQDFPNSGSIFKNISSQSAGKLIEDAGWKGKKLGGAMVSPKHANFIINTGNAKAMDIYNLMKLIQSDIYFKFKVKLQPELKLMGDFPDEED